MTVEVTHPLLHWQCGNKNAVYLTIWRGCTGTVVNVPDELHDKIIKMKAIATMEDHEALKLSNENKSLFIYSFESIGCV